MMKKLIISLISLFVLTVSANAMSYNQARRQALFLTDKMAYELNLTDDQYEAAYEINLDYLVSCRNDLGKNSSTVDYSFWMVNYKSGLVRNFWMARMGRV